MKRGHGRLALVLLAVAAATVSMAVLFACGAFSGTSSDGDDGDGRDGSIEGASAEGAVSEGGVGLEGSVLLDGATCSANLMTDLNNCGACLHECGGASCVGGYCTPKHLNPSPLASQLMPGSHIAVTTDTGWFTDNNPSGGGSGLPGWLYQFVPNGLASAPPNQKAGNHAYPSFIVVAPSDDTHHWSGADKAALVAKIDESNVAGVSAVLGLAVDNADTMIAARIDGGVQIFSAPYNGESPVAKLALPGANTGLGYFGGGDDLLVASGASLQYCPANTFGGDTPCTAVISPMNPVTYLAIAGERVVFATTTDEVRATTFTSVPAPGTTAGIAIHQLNAVRAVAVDPDAAYALDATGIHTSRFGELTLVSNKDPIIDFAVSGEWIYYIVSGGLWCVHR